MHKTKERAFDGKPLEVVEFDVVPAGELDKGEVERVMFAAEEVTDGNMSLGGMQSLNILHGGEEGLVLGALSKTGGVLGAIFGIEFDDNAKLAFGLSELQDDKVLEVRKFVDPEFQGRGVGTKLLEGMMKVAGVQGYGALVATTDENNRLAIGSLQSSGFDRIDTREARSMRRVIYVKRLNDKMPERLRI